MEQNLFDKHQVIFSDNRKVSPRQIRRTVTLELFGISSLILPGKLAASGMAGIGALAVGASGAWLLLLLFSHLPAGSDPAGLKDTVSRPQRVIQLIGGLILLLLAALVLYTLASLLQEHLLEERGAFGILLSLAAAGAFGIVKGLEARIRVYEILFWLLLIPLVIILICACVNVYPGYWRMPSGSAEHFVKNSYLSFLMFSLSSSALLSCPHCSQPKEAYRSAGRALLTAFGLDVGIYLILTGVFQEKLLTTIRFPAILLMEVVRIPGRFIERGEAFMIAIWFFSVFALFHGLLFYGKELLIESLRDIGKACEKKKYAHPAHSTWERTVAGCICAAGCLAAAFRMTQTDGLAGRMFSLVQILLGPVLLCLPAVFYLFRRRT